VTLRLLKVSRYNSDFAYVSAAEDEDGRPDDWSLTGHITCVAPEPS
jgi:hypothetical protein